MTAVAGSAAGSAHGGSRRRGAGATAATAAAAVAVGALAAGLAAAMAWRQPVDRPNRASERTDDARYGGVGSRMAPEVAPLQAAAPPGAVASSQRRAPSGVPAPRLPDLPATGVAAMVGGLSIRPQPGGALDLDGDGIDRRQGIASLAAATGTRLYGAESLPASLGTLTVHAAGVDRAEAWQRLLDGAAVGFASACDRRSCAVWFAAPHPVATAQPLLATTAIAVLQARVESSEGEN